MNKTKIEWTDIFNGNRGYIAGYIAGMTDGDGTFKMPTYKNTYRENQWYWRIAVKDKAILKRVRQYLRRLGIRLNIRPFYGDIYKIETRKANILIRIKKITTPSEINKDFKRGYLAGIFDAEGNWHRSNLRIYNSNQEIRNRIITYANDFGFRFIEEIYPSQKVNGVRLKGDRFDQAKFLCVIKSVKSKWYLRHIFWDEH